MEIEENTDAMNGLNIFLYEWKHFSRSPFKVVALLLFVFAGVSGLHNGGNLYYKQLDEIERIKAATEKSRQKHISSYEDDNRARPDLRQPILAIWFSYIYHFKEPSPLLVYSIGQTEQYGFYKWINIRASPYDSDMIQEIANPERLQMGTLDFAFALLFLLPLLLMILLYNLKSAEAEQGFLPLIEIQVTSRNAWLLLRSAFYVILLVAIIVILLLYGALLTPVMSSPDSAFSQMLLYSVLYLLLWTAIFYFILRSGKSIMSNTLKMAGTWLLLSFIAPGIVHQWVSLSRPANLMTDIIDVRDKRLALYAQPDSILQSQIYILFPEIIDGPTAMDSTQINLARNPGAYALVNELMKESIALIEADNQAKNVLIRSSFGINPISFFQNRFNRIAQTHYDDYQAYRDQIQTLIDKQIRTMILDTWDNMKVDKAKYVEYHKTLSKK